MCIFVYNAECLNKNQQIALLYIYALLKFCLLARSIATYTPSRVGSVGSVSTSRTLGREFTSRPGHTKTIIKMVQTASLHGTQCVRVGVGQCSPTV